jgi:hypothetical protein
MEHGHGGESNRCDKVQSFIYAQLHVTTSLFHYNYLDLLSGFVE